MTILIRPGGAADVAAAVSIFERSNLAYHAGHWRQRLYRSRGFAPTGRAAAGQGAWARQFQEIQG